MANNIEKLLEALNQVVGIKGSMLVTQDGMVVLSRLGTETPTELVAAVASSTIKNMKHAIVRLGADSFSQLVITASFGRMVFVDVEMAFLVAVTEPSLNLDQTLIEVRGVAQRLKSAGLLRVD